MDEWMNERNVFYTMDNGGTPNSQQFRPLSYADVCRPGTLTDHSSALSAAYHSRYLASLPLSAGSSHPFLNGMFPGSSISPTTSFRATSAGLRQFWPPTPPPEGYGRYGINTSLFPLFGTVSPPSDTSAYMAVSRLSTASHMPHLVDSHKDPGFLSPGYNMVPSLTGGGHAHPTTSFSPVIPGLENPCSFSHAALSKTEGIISQGTSESHNSKAVVNPYKHDKYSLNQRPKSENHFERGDHRKPSLSSSSSHSSKEKQEDLKSVRKSEARLNNRVQSQAKLSPCEIDIHYQSSSIKPDILSPPLESPKPVSPKLLAIRKQECSPMLIPSSPFSSKSENQCLTCAAHLKAIDAGAKPGFKKVATSENSEDENKNKAESMSPLVQVIPAEMSNAVTGGPSSKSISMNNPCRDGMHENSQRPYYSFTEPKPNNSNRHFSMSPKQKDLPNGKASHSAAKGIGDSKGVCHTDLEKGMSKRQEVKVEVSELKSSVNQTGKLDVVKPVQALSNSKSSSPSRVKIVEPQKISSRGQQHVSQSFEQCEENVSFQGLTIAFNENGSMPPIQNRSSKSNTNDVPSSVQCSTMKVDSEENPSKYSLPVMKTDMIVSNSSSSSQKTPSAWVKAAISPFNRQMDSEGHFANSSASKITCDWPVSTVNNSSDDAGSITSESDKIAVGNISPVNTGVVGVCHPNSKRLMSVTTLESKSLCSSPALHSEIATEVHMSSKSSFQAISHSPTPSIKTSSILNTSIHSKTLKSERLTTRRTKVGDIEKILSRGTLATLAPKLTKKTTFLKDSTSHHTIATSSSVSSTSIVFPASVNPCIPVGIAIAQQRQDSSASSLVGKAPTVTTTTAGIVPTVTHSTPIASEFQTSELIRDQKPQETSADSTNFLVTQGPTILSRQWESEAVTRATLPSPWVTHGPIVTPALWIGQGAYATAPPTTPMPPTTAPVETSPIALPPGGYQLARDSITGHLFLIPSANIVERTPLWPSYNTSAPLQQVMTQQHHTQFEQVIPQVSESEQIQDCLSLTVQQTDMGEPNKKLDVCFSSNSVTPNSCKSEERLKSDEKRDCSVPLASGQAFTFTTFPTNCDPSSFSYVLQSSTVMHLAHTQSASSIQTESGKRSQGTSPLHCATPSPINHTEQGAADDESDAESVACSETIQADQSPQNQFVTTAIQVDMDSQTNSEADEDDSYLRSHSTQDVLMSDSANQTEILITDSEKSDVGEDYSDLPSATTFEKNCSISHEDSSSPVESTDLQIEEETNVTTGPFEVLPTETELAPSLPVESQPVIDFIDHHGLNLLVDSIEEFASREKGISQHQLEPIAEKTEYLPVNFCDKTECLETKLNSDVPQQKNSVSQSYGSLDTTCTDGLGLLCALAEQRFFEESLNVENDKLEKKRDVVKSESVNPFSNDISSGSRCESTTAISPENMPEHLKACELEMRRRLADLQRKYKEKELELARLNPNFIFDNQPESPAKKNFFRCKKRSNVKSFVASKLKSAFVLSSNKSIAKRTSLSVSTQRLLLRRSIFQKKKMKLTNKSANAMRCVSLGGKQTLMKQKKSEQTHKPIQLVKKKLTTVKQEKIYVSQENEKDRSKGSQNNVHKKKSLQSGNRNLSGNYATTKTSIHLGKAIKRTKLKKFRSSRLCKSIKIAKHENKEQLDDLKCEDSRQPVFDESAWFIRRSERIFLSDARLPASQQPVTGGSPKKAIVQTASTSNLEAETKEDKKKVKTKSAILSSPKGQDNTESSSCDSSASDDESSSHSDNIPLCKLVEQSSLKEKYKSHTTCVDSDEDLSEDLPLSVLKVQNSTKVGLKSCILTPLELCNGTRVLILDEGLFYAGHITAIQAPDVYGIILDGERAHRPHIFSREEILNAAVLEIKPDDIAQLPEGCRICAFWSQQYRCLYPGTVAKATSPLPDSAILYVEFDDGDSGRIPLDDIRILPTDFPIVSMEPNPLLILGKRRARIDSEHANDQKKCNSSSPIKNADKTDPKKFKRQKLESVTEVSVKGESLSGNNITSTAEDISKSEGVKRKENGHFKTKPSVKELEKSVPSCSSTSDIVKSTCDGGERWMMVVKSKKHKKHKDDHKHHHRHHRHHHHHHKKHKAAKQSCSLEAVTSGASKGKKSSDGSSDSYHTFCSEQKSELTMKITTSHDQETANHEEKDVTTSHEQQTELAKRPKTKKNAAECKPEKRKARVSSVEKSKIAAFLPVRQLWRWSGKGYKRATAKGKAKKEFYRAIQRGKELLRVGDCAVFLSTGRPHLPYIGRIETMWESWGGKMDVKVKWFYHPEETKSSKKLVHLKQGALFQSPHFDENDVQTISHKCEVLPWEQYVKQKQHEAIPECASYNTLFDNNDTYYLAGTYDPISGSLVMEADIPKLPSV